MKIAIFAPGFPSWAKMDSEILSSFGDVAEINVLDRGWKAFSRAVRELRRADLCYFWFGSLRHLPFLLLAWLFDKRVIVVAGGYDVNRNDEIGYGQIRMGWLRGMVFDLADKVIAVSEYTRDSALENLDLSPEKVETVHLAVRIPETSLTPWGQRQTQAVFLISAAEDMFLVKGVDRIPDICRSLPGVKFKFAGRLTPDVLKFLEKDKPANLDLIGWLEFQSPKFLSLLNESRVICIPSRLESFGAAAFDGAAMGCIPVAFEVGALPEVLKNIGVMVMPNDSVSSFAASVGDATGETGVEVASLRAKVRDGFSIERRRNSLARVIGVWHSDTVEQQHDH